MKKPHNNFLHHGQDTNLILLFYSNPIYFHFCSICFCHTWFIYFISFWILISETLHFHYAAYEYLCNLPLTLANRSIKYLGIHITDDAKDLYKANFVTCISSVAEMKFLCRVVALMLCEQVRCSVVKYWASDRKDASSNLSATTVGSLWMDLNLCYVVSPPLTALAWHGSYIYTHVPYFTGLPCLKTLSIYAKID